MNEVVIRLDEDNATELETLIELALEDLDPLTNDENEEVTMQRLTYILEIIHKAQHFAKVNEVTHTHGPSFVHYADGSCCR